MHYKKVLRRNTSHSGITQSGRKTYNFANSMVNIVKAKKLNSKLRGASARIRDFRGAPIEVPHTPCITVINGGCDDLGYKNKETVSTGGIVNTILEIGKLCQSHGVKDIFISSLICKKNNYQNNKVNTINNLLRSARDSMRFHFIDNSSIARKHLADDGIILTYAGTEVLLENITFCLNNFL